MAPTAASLALSAGHPLQRVGRIGLIAGLVGVVACIAGAALDPTQFLRSYLVAFVFWIGCALGCLALLMINHVTGGAWGVAIRRFLESGTATLPVMFLAFAPIALGLPRLYEWADPAHVAHDALLQHKQLYLNVPFFVGRAVFYFAAWVLLARALRRWSLAQDTAKDDGPTDRLELISRGGLVLMGLTMTFAAIDWMMSLEPHWQSTIYGILFMSGSALTAFAVVIPLTAVAAARHPMAQVVTADQFHDLGKLLLGFVMLWAYFNFSQFLIIWSANLPEEIPWFLKRIAGGWQAIVMLLVAFHFALPFVVLLSRSAKRRAQVLATLTLILLLFRYLDVFWLIAPAFHPDGVTLHWLDLATLVGLGGVWIAVFIKHLGGAPLVPLNDPSLPLPE